MSNKAMVENLRQRGYIRSKNVEEAMLSVDRALFTPKSAYPYEDAPYPVGKGQTISAPGVVAFMLEHLDVKPGMKVLEVGTASGYNAALLSRLVGPKGKVITMERIPELTEIARVNLEKIGSPENVEMVVGDGSCGYEKKAPYDRIIVTAAMPYLDEKHPLISQLKKNGKIVAPVSLSQYGQDLVVYDKKSNIYKKILPVVFVPLIGKYGYKE